jgi:hypothetical protein
MSTKNNYPKDRVMNPNHVFLSENSRVLGDRAFFLAKWGRITPDKHDELCFIRIQLLNEAALVRKQLHDFSARRAVFFAANQVGQCVTPNGKKVAENALVQLKATLKASVRVGVS